MPTIVCLGRVNSLCVDCAFRSCTYCVLLGFDKNLPLRCRHERDPSEETRIRMMEMESSPAAISIAIMASGLQIQPNPTPFGQHVHVADDPSLAVGHRPAEPASIPFSSCRSHGESTKDTKVNMRFALAAFHNTCTQRPYSVVYRSVTMESKGGVKIRITVKPQERGKSVKMRRIH